MSLLQPVDPPPESMRALVKRLLDVEAGTESAALPLAHAGVRVCDKLRMALTRFAGEEGFLSLIRRAMALARATHAHLETVKVNSDGSLEGLEALAAVSEAAATEAALAVNTQLMDLLVTFIGKSLTLRLVTEAWPDTLLDT